MADNLKDAIIEHFATQAFVKWVSNKRKDAMTMSFLTGSKTYIVAGVLLVISGLQLFGVTIPGIPPIPPGDAITGILSALGLTAARLGANTQAAKALAVAQGTSVTAAHLQIDARKTDAKPSL